MPTMLAAFADFGTVPEWIGLAVVVIGTLLLTLVLRGGQVGPALSYLREANAVLEKEVEGLKATVKEQAREIAELRATRDLEPLTRALLEEMRGHESRAEARFQQTSHLLTLIETRLGPDS